MSKFRVRVLKDTTLYSDVEVEAEDEAEAEEIAQMRALQGEVKFLLSDDASAPYIADDETEEVEDD